MIWPELLKADIPAGEYAWAMKEIQEGCQFIVDCGEICDPEIEGKIKSFCAAFELLMYASKMQMKAGEPK
jgi:hypothetical protein